MTQNGSASVMLLSLKPLKYGFGETCFDSKITLLDLFPGLVIFRVSHCSLSRSNGDWLITTTQLIHSFFKGRSRRIEWRGVEWSGVEWRGVEWRGVGCGVEWCGVVWQIRSGESDI